MCSNPLGKFIYDKKSKNVYILVFKYGSTIVLMNNKKEIITCDKNKNYLVIKNKKKI